MVQTIVKVDGMMCGMCESHINDAVRNAFPVKKVTSSRVRGETEILSESSLDCDALQRTIEATGYTVSGIVEQPYEKKGFFLFRK